MAVMTNSGDLWVRWHQMTPARDFSNYLVGGWATYPSEKWWSEWKFSWDFSIPNWMESQNPNVPNHQSTIFMVIPVPPWTLKPHCACTRSATVHSCNRTIQPRGTVCRIVSCHQQLEQKPAACAKLSQELLTILPETLRFLMVKTTKEKKRGNLTENHDNLRMKLVKPCKN